MRLRKSPASKKVDGLDRLIQVVDWTSLLSPLSNTITWRTVLLPILWSWSGMQVNDNLYTMSTANTNYQHRQVSELQNVVHTTTQNWSESQIIRDSNERRWWAIQMPSTRLTSEKWKPQYILRHKKFWMRNWWSYLAHWNALSRAWREPETYGAGGFGSDAIHHPTGIRTVFMPFLERNQKSPSWINVSLCFCKIKHQCWLC